MEGERERVETTIIFLDRLSSKVFEELCSVSEAESVGVSLGSSVCVCVSVVPPSVPVVTLLFSHASFV